MPPNDIPADRESFLYVKVAPADKTAWVRAAQKERSNLAEWVITQLNERAKLVLGEKKEGT